MDIAQKKVVLFICPAFFGYEILIKNAILNNGYEVDYFDERTSNNSLMKAVFRFKKDLLDKIIQKYYTNILEQIKNKKYDYFFLIKGEVVTENFIVEFKKNNPTAKLVYYSYDSMNNNNQNSTQILKYFDRCFSFDFEDVKKYPFFKLKHLFFGPDYLSNTSLKTKERQYDISFVGTLHSNRFNVMKSIFEKFDDSFVFLYSPAKWWFALNKLTNKEYRKIRWSDVSFSKLSQTEVATIFKSSKSVLDVQRFGQSGLTARTFEVLAAGAILITTNQYIKQAEFYNENDVIIIEDILKLGNIEDIKIKIENHVINTSKMDKYYVDNWVNEFFE